MTPALDQTTTQAKRLERIVLRDMARWERMLRQFQPRVFIELDCFNRTGSRAVSVRGLEAA